MYTAPYPHIGVVWKLFVSKPIAIRKGCYCFFTYIPEDEVVGESEYVMEAGVGGAGRHGLKSPLNGAVGERNSALLDMDSIVVKTTF